MVPFLSAFLVLKFKGGVKIARRYTGVVRGDINFGILLDPLNFLPPMDLNRSYLTEFLIENASFLLTKALFF